MRRAAVVVEEEVVESGKAERAALVLPLDVEFAIGNCWLGRKCRQGCLELEEVFAGSLMLVEVGRLFGRAGALGVLRVVCEIEAGVRAAGESRSFAGLS